MSFTLSSILVLLSVLSASCADRPGSSSAYSGMSDYCSFSFVSDHNSIATAYNKNLQKSRVLSFCTHYKGVVCKAKVSEMSYDSYEKIIDVDTECLRWKSQLGL